MTQLMWPVEIPAPAALLAWIALIPALALIAAIDCRRLVIDPWLCAVAALAGCVIADPASARADGLLGGAYALALGVAIRHIRPGAIGLGDLYLYCLCGFLTGFTALPVWWALHVSGMACLTLVSSIRRRRKFRRTMVPAAVSACPATILAMLILA